MPARYAAAIVALLSFFLAMLPSQAILSEAVGTVRMTQKGLDKCQAPSHPQMRDFYEGTPWYWWGVYIGGSHMLCDNDNVTADWVSTEVQRGWRLMFIWVGPQAPCSNFTDRISSNPDVAYDQGKLVAKNAYLHATGPASEGGLSVNKDFPIVYDIEGFDTTNDTCVRAVKAFLRGWVTYLHADPAQTAGVYGSSCASAVSTYSDNTPPPDFLWGANYGNGPDVDVMSCVSKTIYDRRHKQYRQEVSITAGDTTLTVDVNCSRGPVYGIIGRVDEPAYTECF